MAPGWARKTGWCGLFGLKPGADQVRLLAISIGIGVGLEVVGRCRSEHRDSAPHGLSRHLYRISMLDVVPLNRQCAGPCSHSRGFWPELLSDGAWLADNGALPFDVSRPPASAALPASPPCDFPSRLSYIGRFNLVRRRLWELSFWSSWWSCCSVVAASGIAGAKDQPLNTLEGPPLPVLVGSRQRRARCVTRQVAPPTFDEYRETVASWPQNDC